MTLILGELEGKAQITLLPHSININPIGVGDAQATSKSPALLGLSLSSLLGLNGQYLVGFRPA